MHSFVTPRPDITSGAGSLDPVMAGLRGNGLAVVDVADRGELLRLANALATIVPHRDSDLTGLTTITDLGQPAGDGFLGFTDRELSPHTDRSGDPRPPVLLMTGCVQAARTGGECVLVDGKAVHDDLAISHPEALIALTTPRSVLFGGAAGHLGSVFAHVGGRITLRLRTDSFAQFSPDVTHWLPLLHNTIRHHIQVLSLAPGQGYVLDNHRWLHGRRAFTGTRVLHRVHGNPRPHLSFSPGFPAPTAAPAPTT